MNNDNFEKEFTNNIKQTTPKPTPPPKEAPKGPPEPSKLPLIIAIILALIVLVESIALTIFLTNYFSEENFEIGWDDELLETSDTADNYVFDDSNNVIAFDLTCTAEDGATYTFNKAKAYRKNDSSTASNSGSYYIIDDSVVVLKDAMAPEDTKTLYYDDTSIIEGTTFYECGESVTDDEE